MRAVSASQGNRDARTNEEPTLKLWLPEKIPARGIALSAPSIEAYVIAVTTATMRACPAGARMGA